MNRLIFITGGARSGKSTFAEELAKKINSSYPDKNSIAYIATSEVVDEEFEERIAEHKKRRGNEFITYEEPMDIGSKAEFAYPKHNVIVIECLTTWLANVFIKEPEIKKMLIKSNTQNMISLFTGKLDPIQKIDNYIELVDGKSHLEISALFNNESKDKTLIVVSNEIGSGIVPIEKETREFRDELGRINKLMAINSHYVFHCVCGIPQRLK